MMAGRTEWAWQFSRAGMAPALASCVLLLLLAAQLLPATLLRALPAAAAHERNADPASEAEEESAEFETECVVALRQQAQAPTTASRREWHPTRGHLSTHLPSSLTLTWMRQRHLATSPSAGLRPPHDQLACLRC